MKHFLGQVWWDYNEKPFNYKGIICLESTIAWGLYTVLLFAFLQNFVEMIADSYSYRAGMILAAVVITVYTFDFSLHLFMAKHERLPRKVEEIRTRVLLFIQR